jgi:hypothetical protein
VSLNLGKLYFKAWPIFGIHFPGRNYPDLVEKVLNLTFEEVDRYICENEAGSNPSTPEPKRGRLSNGFQVRQRGLILSVYFGAEFLLVLG